MDTMRAMLAAAVMLAAAGAASACGPASCPDDAAIQAADAIDPVAMVNGHPIRRERLVELLIQRNGKDALQALVAVEVLKQAAAEKNISVTATDIAKEEELSCPPELKNLKPDERKMMLAQYLGKNGLTQVDWQMALERNAYLRKLAEQMPMPEDKELDRQLRERYSHKYGEKVQVRHIEVGGIAELGRARELLKTEPFEKVAREVSIDWATRPTGGLIEPFDRLDPRFPKAVKDAAFELHKAGDISMDFVHNGTYHLIQLVQRIPPEKITYEEARPGLLAELKESRLRVQMRHLLINLPAQSKIEVFDPVIKEQIGQDQAASGQGLAPAVVPPKQ